MKFVFPCIEYEQKANEFIREFHAHASEPNGTGGLEDYLEHSTYSDWLAKVRRDIDIASVPENRVPALTYFYVRDADEKLIGMVNIRLALNDFLRKEGGHIGYCIRPTERRRGYGTDLLKETLRVCRTIGLHHFILTCGKENPASAGVIRNCGGVLDAEFYSDTFGETIQRFYIASGGKHGT